MEKKCHLNNLRALLIPQDFKRGQNEKEGMLEFQISDKSGPKEK